MFSALQARPVSLASGRLFYFLSWPFNLLSLDDNIMRQTESSLDINWLLARTCLYVLFYSSLVSLCIPDGPSLNIIIFGRNIFSECS